MKTILRNTRLTLVIALIVAILGSSTAQAQTFSTRMNGNWNNPATWTAGFVPPLGTLLVTATININHVVTYNSNLDIINLGTLKIVNTTGTVPALILPSGVKFTNGLTGKVVITDAELRQHRFVGGGNSGTPQTGEFKNSGGIVEIKNSKIEIAGKWVNDAGGKRTFKKGLLLLGEGYELKDAASIDTLDKVSVSLGWFNNGDFKISAAKIYFNQAKIQIAGTNSKYDFSSGTGTGDIDYITFKNNVTNVTGTGELKMGPASTTTNLNLDAYCVSAANKYNPNGKFVGSQSFDCALSYFPSQFVIQQGTNLNAGLSFTNPQPVGTASLAVGGRYKFANVNDSTDAIVRIDSLINGATVENIDDNTPNVGYNFAFQPRVRTGNQGKSYAVFSISFLKKGTNTPISVPYINATPIDIDGSATLKEYAELDMGTGAKMSYMSNTMDISLIDMGNGIYRAQNILGIERDNLDTISYNNMFTVANTDMSSLKIKYGAVTTNNTHTTRQFSLYMKGFSYVALHTMPVKMTSFTATLVDEKKVDLKWVTASEINVSHFVIEKSLDGSNFSEAGVVFAYGNSSIDRTYTMTDVLSNTNDAVIYYRIRSVDDDGSSELSSTRAIRITSKNQSNVTLLTYPNPASNELRITVPASWQNKKVVYELYTANGQAVRRTENANSSQTETLNISTLAPGFYMVRVSCNGEVAQQKIVKQ